MKKKTLSRLRGGGGDGKEKVLSNNKAPGRKNISYFHQLRMLHTFSVLRQSQGVLVSPGFPKNLKLGMLQGQTQPKVKQRAHTAGGLQLYYLVQD